MVLLHKITWKEFECIVDILKKYKPIAVDMNPETGPWIDEILSIFSEVEKKPYNIDVNGLNKCDLRTIATIVDMWNVLRNPVCSKNMIPYDNEYEKISSKLQRAYFNAFSEQVFANS